MGGRERWSAMRNPPPSIAENGAGDPFVPRFAQSSGQALRRALPLTPSPHPRGVAGFWMTVHAADACFLVGGWSRGCLGRLELERHESGRMRRIIHDTDRDRVGAVIDGHVELQRDLFSPFQ